MLLRNWSGQRNPAVLEQLGSSKTCLLGRHVHWIGAKDYYVKAGRNEGTRLTVCRDLAIGNNTWMLRSVAFYSEDTLGSCGRRRLCADGMAHMLVFCHFAASQVDWPWGAFYFKSGRQHVMYQAVSSCYRQQQLGSFKEKQTPVQKSLASLVQFCVLRRTCCDTGGDACLVTLLQ